MSLRLRAVLIAGIALSLLWALAAAWMLRDVHGRLDRTLDQRLAMSARMVSGLLERAALAPDATRGALADAVTVGGGQGIACQIRTLRGEIVAATEGAPLSALESPRPGYADRSIGGEAWRTYTLRSGDYHITTADRRDERDRLVRGILLAAGVPFLVAMLGGLLALWIGIGRGLAPLDALRRTLQARTADATDPVDGARAPPELRPVVAALNDLLARLADALRQQRVFTDAAAHELRTPLTAIDTHLQVARMRRGDAAEDSLRQAGEGVHRLRRTLDQLLLLARAEAPAAVDDPCDSVLAAVGDLLARLPAAARERVSMSVTGGDAATPVPRSMLVTAVRNLVDNALRHAPAPSSVALRIGFDEAARQLRIEVADHGPGLSTAQLVQAGRRFWRGDQGRSGGEGSGLGISIVHAIAARHGGRLVLRAREGADAGTGLVAVLELPLS